MTHATNPEKNVRINSSRLGTTVSTVGADGLIEVHKLQSVGGAPVRAKENGREKTDAAGEAVFATDVYRVHPKNASSWFDDAAYPSADAAQGDARRAQKKIDSEAKRAKHRADLEAAKKKRAEDAEAAKVAAKQPRPRVIDDKTPQTAEE